MKHEDQAAKNGSWILGAALVGAGLGALAVWWTRQHSSGSGNSVAEDLVDLCDRACDALDHELQRFTKPLAS